MRLAAKIRAVQHNALEADCEATLGKYNLSGYVSEDTKASLIKDLRALTVRHPSTKPVFEAFIQLVVTQGIVALRAQLKEVNRKQQASAFARILSNL